MSVVLLNKAEEYVTHINQAEHFLKGIILQTHGNLWLWHLLSLMILCYKSFNNFKNYFYTLKPNV